MKRLAMDTSTDRASIAVQVDDKVYEAHQTGVKQHAQVLLPMVETLLDNAGVTLAQLDALVFGCGPGSFTGLRITLSVAKALAYVHALPMMPVSSLAAIAYDMRTHVAIGEHVLAMMDARMNQVYWGVFQRTDADHMVLQDPLRVSDVGDVSVGQPVLIAGAGLEPYLAQLSPSITVRSVHACFPQARVMLDYAAKHAIDSVSASDAAPLYIRQQVTQGEKNG